MTNKISSPKSAAPSRYFQRAAKSVGEMKPSTVPATIKSGMMPSARRTARPPSKTRDALLGSVPGNRSPLAIKNPPPPAMNMAGSSRTPCGTTKLKSWLDIPACQQAALTTPKSNPLSESIQSVPAPAVIPSAKVEKETLRLLVMIVLEANGLMEMTEWVHI